MIRNPQAYQRSNEVERWRRLAEMSVEDSIRVGEALLTSELMDRAVFTDDDRPQSLARALGIAFEGP